MIKRLCINPLKTIHQRMPVVFWILALLVAAEGRLAELVVGRDGETRERALEVGADGLEAHDSQA